MRRAMIQERHGLMMTGKLNKVSIKYIKAYNCI
jgi:hypothetical protein